MEIGGRTKSYKPALWETFLRRLLGVEDVVVVAVVETTARKGL